MVAPGPGSRRPPSSSGDPSTTACCMMGPDRIQAGRRGSMDEHATRIAPMERPPTSEPTDGDVRGSTFLADPRALTILTTEHWSLLSQRSLSWTESFSRAGMFLATLSAATVALAL